MGSSKAYHHLSGVRPHSTSWRMHSCSGWSTLHGCHFPHPSIVRLSATRWCTADHSSKTNGRGNVMKCSRLRSKQLRVWPLSSHSPSPFIIFFLCWTRRISNIRMHWRVNDNKRPTDCKWLARHTNLSKKAWKLITDDLVYQTAITSVCHNHKGNDT